MLGSLLAAREGERIVPKKIAIVNQKGGVGKTTTCVGIASSASAAGLRVLLIDLDPQANTTEVVGVHEDYEGEVFTANDLLHGAEKGTAVEAIVPSTWEGVDLIAAELALAARDADQNIGNELRLRKTLDSPEIDRYDLILIDCQPSVGKLVANALAAADAALIVTEPARMALKGVSNVLDTIEQVREYFAPNLETAGIVLNNVNHTRESKFRTQELLDGAPEGMVWEPFIPSRAIIVEAAGANLPIHSYPPSTVEDLPRIFDSFLNRILDKEVA